jgi:hypothetical protein
MVLPDHPTGNAARPGNPGRRAGSPLHVHNGLEPFEVIPNHPLTRLFMDARKRDEIEAKLRQLMENSSMMKPEAPEHRAAEPPRGYAVIRRRKGQQDKRIFVPE